MKLKLVNKPITRAEVAAVIDAIRRETEADFTKAGGAFTDAGMVVFRGDTKDKKKNMKHAAKCLGVALTSLRNLDVSKAEPVWLDLLGIGLRIGLADRSKQQRGAKMKNHLYGAVAGADRDFIRNAYKVGDWTRWTKGEIVTELMRQSGYKRRFVEQAINGK